MTGPLKRDVQTNRANRKFEEHVDLRPTIDINGSQMGGDRLARIFRPSRSVMTSARVSRRPWLLVFEQQVPPVIDYLMGYTGGRDTLTQVELRFPSRDAAIAYAERNKLDYIVVDDRGVTCSFRVRERA
ncbi:NADH dehydrogenase [Sinorhizobium glycinis]|uniref:NADH dehydrogenase n=1 Tax=Sinorhizobium glycinis TaxID=1472378 RepID=A0A178XTQ7_9HYPH|nr:NADH dehydrogenase ubiquinone Fe-S protein 4 [Sinorhizobium glycinis]OAP38587.1 NADH dehydrogenase [Sinorhizobium glycinis]